MDRNPPRYRVRQPLLETIDARVLDPAFVAAVREGTPSAFERVVARPCAGVLEFELFTPAFCEALLREIHAFEHWCRHREVRPTRPNAMNHFGVVLEQMGIDDAIDGLITDWIVPIAGWAFPHHAGATLDHTHSFVVEYCERGDVDLALHVDDAEVTLNACLGVAFEGSEVFFAGERCVEHRQTDVAAGEAWTWTPTPRRAILHAGAHRHGVRTLRTGRRINLVVWARSSRHRIAHPTPHAGPATWCPLCAAP